MFDPMNDEFMPLFANDPVTATLNSQLEKLTIDVNIHELQLRIESIKCQKIASKIRRVKKDIINKNKFIQDTLSKLEQLKYTVNAHNMLHEKELTHLRTLTFRRLARMQHLMTNTVPYVPLSKKSHNNLAQLMDELNRTFAHLQQPSVDPDTSPNLSI